MIRSIVVALCVLCGFCAMGARARAAAEFCPARVTPLVGVAAPGNTFAYTVRAESPRAASGEVFADTDQGWYSWRFPMTLLQPAKMTVRAGVYSADEDVFASPQLFVSFPQHVTVRRAFVRSASTSGETVFGWDSEGSVTCEPPAFDDRDAVPNAAHAVSHQAAAPSASHVANAQPMAAPFSIACDVPFAPPSVKQLERTTISEDYTAAVSDAVIVGVGLDSHARVLDAWLLGSSGSVTFDQAALREGRDSIYSPAISYCKAVPSIISLPIRFK